MCYTSLVNELVDELSIRTGLHKTQCRMFLKLAFDKLFQELKSGTAIIVPNFGKFEQIVKEYKNGSKTKDITFTLQAKRKREMNS